MKELLLDDAHRLSASIAEYEATRQQIDAAVYQTFTLDEADFNDLVFMEANDNVWADNQALVETLTPKGKSRTLKEVVDRILKVYPYQSPIKVFKQLSADEPWFEGCFIISARFDPRLMGELLVRPLTAYENPHILRRSGFTLKMESQGTGVCRFSEIARSRVSTCPCHFQPKLEPSLSMGAINFMMKKFHIPDLIRLL